MNTNTGDTAWILISAALVMLMTPGLALFYGGMVRRKNLLSTMMMSFSALGLVGILWMLYGYSLTFGPDHWGIIGGLDWVGFRGVGAEPSAVYATTVPHLAFAIYQAMFAVITVALITGAVVERMKFSAVLLFSALWFTIVYIPVAHWVWGSGGFMARMGVIDFAGGIVVHITAGVSAMTMALLLGPRKGYLAGDKMEPNSIPLVAIGAALLWFGWFGFNAGSALSANAVAVNAFVTTNTSGAAAGLTWMFLGWYHGRPSLLGTVTGAVVGLAAVTPAAGFITPMAAIPIGIIAAFISYYVMIWRAAGKRVDESLDVWACHGMGGTWGTIAAGIFATLAVNAAGASGLVEGNISLLLKQLFAVVVVWVFSFAATWSIGKIIDKTIGLRVSTNEEAVGLDIAQHGERAYGGQLR